MESTEYNGMDNRKAYQLSTEYNGMGNRKAYQLSSKGGSVA